MVILVIFISGCEEGCRETPLSTLQFGETERVFKEELRLTDNIASYKDWVHPTILGDLLNSNWSEDAPHISADGKTMYLFIDPTGRPMDTAEDFFMRGRMEGVGVYRTTLVEDRWIEPTQIKLREPGTWGLDGSLHTQDGKVGYFNTQRDESERVDIYAYYFADKRVERLPAPVNGKGNDGEPHISTDGTKLYFASDRMGGQGRVDIWTSELKDGVWQELVNLSFNSIEDDTEPYVTPDGKTMYFRRSSFIYETRLEEGEWTEPKLLIRSYAGVLGHPSMTEDGEYLYYSHITGLGTEEYSVDIMRSARKW